MKTYIGIDWKTYNVETPTTVCILKKMNDGNVKTTIIELTLETPYAQVELIERLIEEHDPNGVVADIGYGMMQCQMLQTKFKDRVKSCYYSSEKNTMSYDENTWMLTVNKDAMMEEAVKFVGGPFKLIDMTLKGLHALNYAYIAYCTDVKRLIPEAINV